MAVDIIRTAYYIRGLELMKLIFTILDVSLTMGFIRYYKREGFCIDESCSKCVATSTATQCSLQSTLCISALDIVGDQTSTGDSLLCTECRETELGLEYMGTQSTTRDGYTCQAWASNTPHDPNSAAKDDSNYPDGSRKAASNYCRNPDSIGGLWCYTTDPSERWDWCDVPLCSGMCITFIVLYWNE